MALFDGLLGGGGSDPMDIYGDLFTEKQRAALRDQQMTQGLLNAAAVFSKAGQASRLPVSIPWGEAAQALGGSGDEAMARMLKGMQVAEEVRKSRQERAIVDKISPIVEALVARGIPRQLATQAATQATGGGAAPAAPGAGLPPDIANIAGPAAWSAAKARPAAPQGYSPPGGMFVPAPPVGDYGAPGAETLPNLPPQQSGLLNPTAYGGSGGGLPGQGVLASLGGGEAGVPLPFGQGSPGSPDLNNIKIEQLSGEAAPAGGNWERDRALIRKYESGGRNIEQQVIGPQGGYNPSVGRVTGPSSASGYYQMIDPTWRAAAAKAGIDTSQYPRAINAPEALQDKAAEALYREQGLAPWAPYNSRLAAATGYQGGGFSGRIEPLGSDAAPAGDGTIPGLNITPQGLAALNAMLKMGGIKSDPFGSLLETYYKSPDYLMQAEAAKQLGGLPFEGPKAAAIAKAQQQYIQQNAAHQSDLDIAKDLITKGGLVQQPDGSYKQITSIREGLAAVEAAKPTGDIKEYNFYAQQAKERGDIPKPFTTWDIERKRAAATMINTAEGQEAAKYKGRIAVDQKIATDAAEKALAVRQMMPLLDESLQLARKTPAGLAGPASAQWGQIAAAFGLPVSAGASNAELLGAINQRLIPMVREPGAQSNAEMDAYLRAGPALMGTEDGRVKIAEMTKAIGQRSIEIARVYREHLGSPKLYDELAKLDKPLFTDEQRVAMSAATSGAAGGAPALPSGYTNTGKTYQGKPIVIGPDGKEGTLN